MGMLQKRCGFTLIELLVVIAINAVLLGLIFAAIQRAREGANRAACLNNAKQIALAAHGYHGNRGSFPPGMTSFSGPDPYPFLSWEARIVPFLEQDTLWRQT